MVLPQRKVSRANTFNSSGWLVMFGMNVQRERISQMKMFVGRRMTAAAALSRLLRNLVTSSVDVGFVFDVGSSVRMRRSFSSKSASSTSPGSAQCHGQLYSATMVNVVSTEFENVRVEKNHCQGLTSVSISADVEAAEQVP